jgi:hypothetical protein
VAGRWSICVGLHSVLCSLAQAFQSDLVNGLLQAGEFPSGTHQAPQPLAMSRDEEELHQQQAYSDAGSSAGYTNLDFNSHEESLSSAIPPNAAGDFNHQNLPFYTYDLESLPVFPPESALWGSQPPSSANDPDAITTEIVPSTPIYPLGRGHGMAGSSSIADALGPLRRESIAALLTVFV